jgi:hypothetical protein
VDWANPVADGRNQMPDIPSCSSLGNATATWFPPRCKMCAEVLPQGDRENPAAGRLEGQSPFSLTTPWLAKRLEFGSRFQSEKIAIYFSPAPGQSRLRITILRRDRGPRRKPLLLNDLSWFHDALEALRCCRLAPRRIAQQIAATHFTRAHHQNGETVSPK